MLGAADRGQDRGVPIHALWRDPWSRDGSRHGRHSGEPDANQLEGDPSKQLQATVPTTNVQRVQNLVFLMPSSSTTAP
jgi:hemolysin D